jgi:Wiskott-Aldrich syndrome protein
VGLNFADETEAVTFYSKVINRENLKVQARRAPTPSSATIGNTLPRQSPMPGPVESKSTSKSSSSKGKKGSGGGSGKIDKAAIGAPTNFRHLTHIGFDPQKGFSVRRYHSCFLRNISG